MNLTRTASKWEAAKVRFAIPAVRVLWGLFAGGFILLLPAGLIVPPVLPMFLGLIVPTLGLASAAVLPRNAARARSGYLLATVAYSMAAAVVLAVFFSSTHIPLVVSRSAAALLLLAPLPAAAWSVWFLGRFLD